MLGRPRPPGDRPTEYDDRVRLPGCSTRHPEARTAPRVRFLMYIKPGPGRFGAVRGRRVQLQLGQQVTVAAAQALLHLGISQQSPLPLVGYGNLVPARRTAYHSLGSDRASIV